MPREGNRRAQPDDRGQNPALRGRGSWRNAQPLCPPGHQRPGVCSTWLLTGRQGWAPAARRSNRSPTYTLVFVFLPCLIFPTFSFVVSRSTSQVTPAPKSLLQGYSCGTQSKSPTRFDNRTSALYSPTANFNEQSSGFKNSSSSSRGRSGRTPVSDQMRHPVSPSALPLGHQLRSPSQPHVLPHSTQAVELLPLTPEESS